MLPLQGEACIISDTYPGSRSIIGQAFEARGVPASVVPVMISSLTIGTLKQYDNPLKLWWEFCKAHGFHLYSASITQILLFLKDLFDKVKSYGTLNSYRSALSLIMNNELGNDPRIRRFFKGVASLKPQKPRYSYTWDPATVLDWLSKVYPNEEISLEKLSKKLVILLALITAQRVQTLN